MHVAIGDCSVTVLRECFATLFATVPEMVLHTNVVFTGSSYQCSILLGLYANRASVHANAQFCSMNPCMFIFTHVSAHLHTLTRTHTHAHTFFAERYTATETAKPNIEVQRSKCYAWTIQSAELAASLFLFIAQLAWKFFTAAQ